MFTEKFVPDKFVHDSYEFVHDQDKFREKMFFFSKLWTNLSGTNLSWTNQEHSSLNQSHDICASYFFAIFSSVSRLFVETKRLGNLIAVLRTTIFSASSLEKPQFLRQRVCPVQ